MRAACLGRFRRLRQGRNTPAGGLVFERWGKQSYPLGYSPRVCRPARYLASVGLLRPAVVPQRLLTARPLSRTTFWCLPQLCVLEMKRLVFDFFNDVINLKIIVSAPVVIKPFITWC